jgi:23S rRNA pseudouridine2605 synthase
VPRNRRPQSPAGDEGPQRIAKLLARAGVASRREIERMIADGRIAVEGVTLKTPAITLTSLRGVTVDGKAVREAQSTRVFRFYKPAGTITAERDTKGRATIYDKLPKGLPRLMPVGRLDFMTEGLLLLTNDGELKRKLELPKTGVVRTYRARAFGAVSQEQLEGLAEGVTIEGMHYGSINANLERRTGRNCWIEMSLTEGKNREIRRVLAHLGLQVSRLIRTAYGPFDVGGMSPGQVDEIPRAALDDFRSRLK